MAHLPLIIAACGSTVKIGTVHTPAQEEYSQNIAIIQTDVSDRNDSLHL
jgi:hypothetical protein